MAPAPKWPKRRASGTPSRQARAASVTSPMPSSPWDTKPSASASSHWASCARAIDTARRAALSSAFGPRVNAAAEANANASFGNLRRLGEISKVLGPCDDLAALEARLGSLTQEEAKQLAQAIESYARRHHAVLLANHGPVVAGSSLSAAVDAVEELEETAKLYLMLRDAKTRYLTPDQVNEVRQAFPIKA